VFVYTNKGEKSAGVFAGNNVHACYCDVMDNFKLENKTRKDAEYEM